MVQGRAGAVVVVEGDAQPGEGILIQGMVFIDDLRERCLLLRPNGNGCPVLVGPHTQTTSLPNKRR